MGKSGRPKRQIWHGGFGTMDNFHTTILKKSQSILIVQRIISNRVHPYF